MKMTMRFTAIWLCLSITATCMARTQEPAADTKAKKSRTPAVEAFERGARLVDRNCAECMDATSQGLSEGIESLKKAIELGYHHPAEAHRLLRDAYANMRAFLKYSDPQRKRYDALRSAEVSEIVKLDPSDLDNRREYIVYVRKSSQADVIKALRELVMEHPEYTLGQYDLSRLLFAIGADEEALPHAERWLAGTQGIEERSSEVQSLLESVPVERVRSILASRPKFHPAEYVLALRLLQQGSTAEGLAHARRALEQAPPAMAALYFESVSGNLVGNNQQAASESLRHDFNAKLREGEAEIQAERP